MTDRHDDPGDARAALRQLPIPEHRATFWDELERRLDALPSVGADAPTSAEPLVPESGPLIELTSPASDRGQRAWRRPLAAAAALLVVGLMAAAVIAVLARGDGDGVQVATPATTAAPSTTESTATSVVGGVEVADGAQAAALEWIDLLAAGDMAAAWERLGPAAQAGWGSYEAFEDASTAFVEGFGTWASAEGREVGVATVTRTDAGTLHVVTLTGVRYPEGNREDGALALPVWEDTEGNYVVEPPSPSGAASVQFTVPVASATPPTIGADETVVVETSGPMILLSLVIDRDEEVVTPPFPSDGTASHVPAKGWSPGRHVVTAVMLGDEGAATTAVVFEVA